MLYDLGFRPWVKVEERKARGQKVLGFRGSGVQGFRGSGL